MFVHVRLLNGYSEPLLYQVPDSLHHVDLVGKIVQVPIRNRVAPAVVINTLDQLPANTRYTVKTLAALEPFPHDLHYQQFLKLLSYYNQVNPFHFVERVRQFIYQQSKRKRSTKKTEVVRSPTNYTLTDEQQKVYDFISPHIAVPAYMPTLLHGVTGSGKTEVYKQLIITTIAAGKSAVLLLPEVTLAIRFEKILRKQLPESITIFSFHSATASSEKRALWQRLLNQEAALIIGVHLPVLLPIPNLGIIIIDEEHEAGYQEKKHPKINSKDAAIWRAQLNKIPIILGSATPSISSLYNVHTKGWHFFQLKHRFAGTLPTVTTVLLTDKKQRRNFWISQQLESAIKNRLAAKEQVIIFINRRGFSFFVQCKTCTHVFACTSCSVSLTLHNDNLLTCHYCGITMQQPTQCPSCKAPETDFIKKGIGTQQVVTILEKLFPYAKIGRADMDTTTKKKLWQQTIKDFDAGNLDILVGTQTITKGFHFPGVTLVGVLWADLNLNFPMFNASETTLQQLLQVAGRAGRAGLRSEVIVQAMADHSIFQYLNEIEYLNFYTQEIEMRTLVGYPPFLRLADIEMKHTDEQALERESHEYAIALQTTAKNKGLNVTVLGPAKPPVSKIKDTHSRKIYLKAADIKELITLYASIDKRGYSSKLYFTPNPLR